MSPVHRKEMPDLIHNAVVVQIWASSTALSGLLAALKVCMSFRRATHLCVSLGAPASLMQSLPHAFTSGRRLLSQLGLKRLTAH